MNKLELLRQELRTLIANMRAIIEKSEVEKRKLTDDEEKIYTAKEVELENLKRSIEREERLIKEEEDLKKTEPPVVGSRGVENTNIEVGKDRIEDKPFRNLGEFVETVFSSPNTPQLRNYQSNIGKVGGFLIPTEFLDTIMKFSPEENIIRTKAKIFSADPAHPDAAIEIPVLTQGGKGVYAGVQTYWTGEGRPAEKSGAEFENISLKPHELTGLTSLTNKALRNASQLSSFVEDMFRMAINGAEDMAFIAGDGIAKPLGLISPKNTGAILVKRNTAGKITYEDIIAMKSKMITTSWGSCFFNASLSALPQLEDLKDSSGNRIYSQILNPKESGYVGMLSGIPLKLTGKVNTLGNVGDLSLVDPNYYLIKDGVAPMIAYSEHVEFVNGKTLVKIVKSVDGQLWNREPLTLEDGKTQVSPVIILK